jgi:hypothetical protein
MLEAAKYSAVELQGNGRRIEVRALRPDDQAELIAAIDRTSAQSLYRRFFATKHDFSKNDIAFFVNVDFTNHVALIDQVVLDAVEGAVPLVADAKAHTLRHRRRPGMMGAFRTD